MLISKVDINTHFILKGNDLKGILPLLITEQGKHNKLSFKGIHIERGIMTIKK